ncbi:MAG: hypothetical protein DKM50_10165 [Candidatus Margulisiibacteriota bacterium]|nr:MAG: hypothetical protein DKM50_10165 [Candidatus Margulisiibacteriota bacterium]HAR64500.1 hypothetical protein [Candidatus Margulisiibacteriota bacterium]HCT84539.1 hypothetical protein [Candidatus Margulisiibacteriota bacterium]HCY37053.1 hypothetical protein [Candidatus Margulisiibacteriota bacterium]
MPEEKIYKNLIGKLFPPVEIIRGSIIILGIKNCSTCGRVFSGPGDICIECKKAEEKSFEVVYKYLRDYPKATLSEVAAITEVSEELISKFVREGRIKAVNLPITGSCIACGKSIDKGHYCVSCISKLKVATSQAKVDLDKKIMSNTNREGPLIKRLLE